MGRVDWRKLLVVFRREYLERIRSKWFLVGTLLGPVFFAMITVVPVVMSTRTKPSTDLANIAILDATGTAMGELVAKGLRERFPVSPAPDVRSLQIVALPREEDRATIQVQDKALRGYLVLDSAAIAGESVRYAGRNASSPSDLEQISAVVRQQVLAQRLAGVGIDPARVAALTRVRLTVNTEKIGDHGREKGSGMGNVIFGYVVAYLLFMMITIYGQTIMRGVMEEKTTRVAEVVVSSVSTDTLLAGKILGVGLVAITQVVAWAMLTVTTAIYLLPFVLRGMSPADLAASGAGAPHASPAMGSLATALPSLSLGMAGALLLYFVLGFIFFASLFAAVGSMVSSQEDIQQAAMPVMLLLISSVVFMAPIMTNPGSALARTMSLIPFSAPILMPLRMTLIPVPWYEVAASLVGVALACIAAIWLSARIYRVGLLMTGKRPSFAELARWVRYAA